jgi:hypothetical protein
MNKSRQKSTNSYFCNFVGFFLTMKRRVGQQGSELVVA